LADREDKCSTGSEEDRKEMKGLRLTRHTRVHSTEILKSKATKFHLISAFFLKEPRQKVEQEQFKQQS